MMFYHKLYGRVGSILILAVAILAFSMIRVDSQLPKVGVGSTYENCAGLQAVGAVWTYNWTKVPYICDGVESVPMVWCDGVGSALGGNSEWLLGPNEPDVYNQCNKMPQDMVPIWREIEEAYPDKLLVSPAVMWILWLRGWRDAYVAEYGRLPRVDAVAVHCYAWTDDVTTAVDYCKQQVTSAHTLGLGNVWVTEWAWLGSDQADGVAYMLRMRAWMDQDPRVERYAWFQLSYSGEEPWALAPNASLVQFDTGALTQYGVSHRGFTRTLVPFVAK